MFMFPDITFDGLHEYSFPGYVLGFVFVANTLLFIIPHNLRMPSLFLLVKKYDVTRDIWVLCLIFLVFGNYIM